MINLKDIIFALTSITIPDDGMLISEAVIDSRKAIPGSMFVALTGERSDGHDFIHSAFERGAAIGLVQRDLSSEFKVLDLRSIKSPQDIIIPQAPFCIRVDDSIKSLQDIARYWRQKSSARVIAITGSVGKSSTKELITEVFNRKFHTFKNPGNYNNEIGLPLTILNLGQGYDRLVLEMGFYYPGEIKFLCGIAKPDVGIVTNIGTVHAERAGSQEAIAKGKAELIESLSPSPDGIAILNFDDPFVKAMASKTQARVIFYGLDSNADVWADEIQSQGLKGIRFCMHYQGSSMVLEVPMLGRHSIQTILRASAAGFAEAMTMQEVAEGLTASNTQLRLVAVQTKSGALILDDTYNATPESTLAALDLLDELKGQKIAVLGDMLELGPYEHAGHEIVGRKAAEVVNHLIAVGPRGQTIAESARLRGLPPTAVTWVANALQAAEVLKYNLKAGDIVLIKGSHGLRMDRISPILEEAA
jgi:UDP-N-acetylmuramoyl-tripeptide--D-alanyl-D-alanine ligase